MQVLENESGRFYVDASGVLRRFVCGAENSLSRPYSPESKALFRLHIPEGVRALPADAFRGFRVTTEVTFPDSLTQMNAGAFSRCDLNHVVLPRYAALGADVFSGSWIRKVTVPEGAAPDCARQAAHALRFTFSYDDPAKEWPAQYADIFYGRNETAGDWTEIRNASGAFFLDSDGVLREFRCEWDNCSGIHRDSDAEAVLYRLHIPEGVRAIPGGMFERYHILWELTFPSTLKCIGSVFRTEGGLACTGNAFARSQLPDVVLPEKLELLGCFSFGGCIARSVTIPASLREHLNHSGTVRAFKDAEIGEIRMPAEYRKNLEACKNRCHGRFEPEAGERHVPGLGRLCYLKSKGGALRGESVAELLNQITLSICR